MKRGILPILTLWAMALAAPAFSDPPPPAAPLPPPALAEAMRKACAASASGTPLSMEVCNKETLTYLRAARPSIQLESCGTADNDCIGRQIQKISTLGIADGGQLLACKNTPPEMIGVCWSPGAAPQMVGELIAAMPKITAAQRQKAEKAEKAKQAADAAAAAEKQKQQKLINLISVTLMMLVFFAAGGFLAWIVFREQLRRKLAADVNHELSPQSQTAEIAGGAPPMAYSVVDARPYRGEHSPFPDQDMSDIRVELARLKQLDVAFGRLTEQVNRMDHDYGELQRYANGEITRLNAMVDELRAELAARRQEDRGALRAAPADPVSPPSAMGRRQPPGARDYPADPPPPRDPSQPRQAAILRRSPRAVAFVQDVAPGNEDRLWARYDEMLGSIQTSLQPREREIAALFASSEQYLDGGDRRLARVFADLLVDALGSRASLIWPERGGTANSDHHSYLPPTAQRIGSGKTIVRLRFPGFSTDSGQVFKAAVAVE